MVALRAMSGEKWNWNLISVKDDQLVVVKLSVARKVAKMQPPTAPSSERIRLSTRKLPSTARRRKPSARNVPTSRTREATCAYMVIIAPSVAPNEKKTA